MPITVKLDGQHIPFFRTESLPVRGAPRRADESGKVLAYNPRRVLGVCHRTKEQIVFFAGFTMPLPSSTSANAGSTCARRRRASLGGQVAAVRCNIFRCKCHPTAMKAGAAESQALHRHGRTSAVAPASASICASLSPASRSTSTPSSPTRGAWRRNAVLVFSKSSGLAKVRTGPFGRVLALGEESRRTEVRVLRQLLERAHGHGGNVGPVEHLQPLGRRPLLQQAVEHLVELAEVPSALQPVDELLLLRQIRAGPPARRR